MVTRVSLTIMLATNKLTIVIDPTRLALCYNRGAYYLITARLIPSFGSSKVILIQ